MASSLSSSGRGWSALREGDIVDLVAPSFPVLPEKIEAAIAFLRGWGLKPRLPRGLQARDLLCANTDAERLRFLREAFYAEDSRAVWCLRGGYGCLRLVPELAKLKAPKLPPKLFVGLSDITTLHTFLTQAWGWPTVHGPLLDRLSRADAIPKYVREMHRFAFGEISTIEFKGLQAMNAAAREGHREIRASVTGGNLAVLLASLGTRSEWNPAGQIVFLEDIGERGYRIDRMLEQLAQAGKFRGVKALTLGQFSEGDEPEGARHKNLVKPVLKRFAESVAFPVYWGVPSGHNLIQRPVPFGARARLSLGVRGQLICDTGVELGKR